jgi:hypothetical protein
MGGAIFNMQGDVTIRASTLAGNSAAGGLPAVPDPGKGLGGAVFNLSGSVEAVGATFADNTATHDGTRPTWPVASETIESRSRSI